VLTVAVLFAEFGSLAAEFTEALAVITVPFDVPLFTFTTNVKVAAVDPAMFDVLHTTLPVLAGVMHVQPQGTPSR